jgi:hypothetical protein
MYKLPIITSNNKIAIYLFLLGIVIGPFLLLSFYCHPLPGDDFHFALRTLELGHWGAVVESYLNWTGRYFLCWALTLRSILHSSIIAYQLFIFLLILTFPITLYFLIKILFRPIDSGHNILLTLILTFIYFYDLPSQDEGLFWYTGAIAYQLPNLLGMTYLILIAKIVEDRYHTKILGFVHIFMGIAIIVIIQGCNEISMAVLLIFNILISVFQFKIRSGPRFRILLLATISFAVAIVVSLAPGNEIRESLFPDRYKIFVTIYMSILGAAYYIMQWLPMILLITLLSLPLILQYLPLKHSFFKISPVISVVVWVILLGVAFIVPAWATGQMPNPRAINVIFMVFILGWFYNLINLINTLKSRNYEIPVLQRFHRILLIIAIFTITFNPSNQLNNNLKHAYKDLISGRAGQYSRRMYAYRDEVRESPVPIYPKLKEIPASFCKYVEGDSLQMVEVHTYYRLKDKIFK